jgi:hypothetical protein
MLNPEVAAFVEGGQDIRVATCNARLEPYGCRVLAAVVAPDHTHLTAFLPEPAAAPILENLAANPQAAFCFGRPTDDVTCQLKGRFVAARPATDAERTVIEAQQALLGQQMAMIAIPEVAFAGWPSWPAVAITIRVEAVFDQTPGPGAGARLS